jgi:hypothetical protein
MTTQNIFTLLKRLPAEIENEIFFYIPAPNPVAELIKEYWENYGGGGEFCNECSMYVREFFSHEGHFWVKDHYDGMCEYCYAETHQLAEVYTCVDCSEKTFTYGMFENTETGLYCNTCYETLLEEEDN